MDSPYMKAVTWFAGGYGMFYLKRKHLRRGAYGKKVGEVVDSVFALWMI